MENLCIPSVLSAAAVGTMAVCQAPRMTDCATNLEYVGLDRHMLLQDWLQALIGHVPVEENRLCLVALVPVLFRPILQQQQHTGVVECCCCWSSSIAMYCPVAVPQCSQC